MIKIALCFIINYQHILEKEEIWKKWILYNKDIINVYFFYKEKEKIKSSWIKNNCIPKSYIKPTDYYHIIPAYIGLIKYALVHDTQNTWFCFLTDSCVPIIDPLYFRYLFFTNYNKSIFSWSNVSWNTNFIKRANLHLLNSSYHLKNTPYFIFTRKNVLLCLHFMNSNKELFITISNGSIANESLFAIILKNYNLLSEVINQNSTITDWNRMQSPTSPYKFKQATLENINFIKTNKIKNKYSVFLRKIDNSFPNDILVNIIFEKNINLKIYLLCKIYSFYFFIYRYSIFLFLSLLSLFLYVYYFYYHIFLLLPFMITN